MMIRELFGREKNKTNRKQAHGKKGMMMGDISMIQSIYTDTKSNEYHKPFKGLVMNNINAKKGEAGKYQGQDCTMNGTSHRRSNPQTVPIHF